MVRHFQSPITFTASLFFLTCHSLVCVSCADALNHDDEEDLSRIESFDFFRNRTGKDATKDNILAEISNNVDNTNFLSLSVALNAARFFDWSDDSFPTVLTNCFEENKYWPVRVQCVELLFSQDSGIALRYANEMLNSGNYLIDAKLEISRLLLARGYAKAVPFVVEGLSSDRQIDRTVATDIVKFSRDKSGRTPLMLAAISGDFESVKAFVKAGANMHAKDYNGFTAMDSLRYRLQGIDSSIPESEKKRYINILAFLETAQTTISKSHSGTKNGQTQRLDGLSFLKDASFLCGFNVTNTIYGNGKYADKEATFHFMASKGEPFAILDVKLLESSSASRERLYEQIMSSPEILSRFTTGNWLGETCVVGHFFNNAENKFEQDYSRIYFIRGPVLCVIRSATADDHPDLRDLAKGIDKFICEALFRQTECEFDRSFDAKH